MRVLLVRPPVPPHTIGLKHIMICEPLELEYAAAGLQGHDVEILDLIVERGLKRRLRRFRPHVVGTSCYITGVNEVIKICRAAKQWNRKVHTVVGGVQAARAPEDFLDGAVDCIVPGDGTTIMPELLEALEGDTPLEQVPGLILPRGQTLIRTAPRAYMPPPDELPFPRRDLVSHLKHRYYYLFHQPVATMKTTWGCWYKCNFCYTWRVTDGTPYSRSPESIADELEQIEAEDVYIVDDIFLINRNRLGRLAHLLRQRGICKKYLVYARADFVAQNEDVIEEWAGLGLTAVFIGLEATTDAELDSMDKECTVDFNRRAIEILRKHRVDTYGSLITQPDYGPDDWARLKRFIDETGLYYLNVSPLTPMPGTLIWDQYKDRVCVSRKAHGLWDLSHMLLPTVMPLKRYYRELVAVYAHACLSPSRAKRLSLRTAPPIWSRKFLRLWMGAFKIGKQFLSAHKHHSPSELARAEYRGPEVPGLTESKSGTPAAGQGALGFLQGHQAQAPAPQGAREDPFEGYFQRQDEPDHSGDDRARQELLDSARAKRWLDVVGWGVETGLYTYQRPLEGPSGAHVRVGGRTMLMMSSYDYLGLIGHPQVEEAAIKALREYGTGSGGVRLLTGTNQLHLQLERELARFKGVEAALTFTSGYAANLAAISALVGPRDRVIIDERSHRSIVDACRMARVALRRFPHNDVQALRAELDRKPFSGRTLIVAEGVYSMDGDICPLADLVELKRRFDALLMVDEAHAFGVLGPGGRGVHEHFGLRGEDVDLWMGSLSKAVPSNGGFLAGSRALVIYLQHESSPFFFSAAACPASVAAARAALRVIEQEPWRLEAVRRNARLLRSGLLELGYDTGASETPIIPVILGENEAAWRVARALEDQGILACAAVPPAVPGGTARLRLCAMASHSEEDIDKLLRSMATLGSQTRSPGRVTGGAELATAQQG